MVRLQGCIDNKVRLMLDLFLSHIMSPPHTWPYFWKLLLAKASGGWTSPKEKQVPAGAAPGQLYDMSTDLGEKKNLYEEKPDMVASLLALLEKDIKKYGILRSDKREELAITNRDVFKIDFLNYINFCDSNNCFPALSTYMKECLKEQGIDFNELFSNVEYKLNLDLGDDKLENIELNESSSEKISLSI